MHHEIESKSRIGLCKPLLLRCFLIFYGGILPACQKPAEAPQPAEPPEISDKQPALATSETTAPTLEEFPQNESPQAADAISRELPQAFACGEHLCREFETARDVLVPLLLSEKPRIVGFGEAHAPADFRGESTVARFTQQILPSFSEGVSYLLIELLVPPSSGCAEEKKEAQKESDTITQGQSKNNQNEYLALGNQARQQGVVPDILRASCEDMKEIASPDGGVLAYMEVISRLFARDLEKRFSETKKGRPFVVAYGGALHNDAAPRPGREAWSYAPSVLKVTQEAYLEVDLVVPELIGDSDSWRSFAWYEAYQALPNKQKTLLMQWGEHSYTLFFAPEQSAKKATQTE